MSFSLKNHLFNKKTITILSKMVEKSYFNFNKEIFIRKTLKGFPKLELKERIAWVRKNLEIQLPKDYRNGLKVLLNSLKDFKGYKRENYVFSAYSDFVAVNGCKKEYLKISLKALGEITSWFSAEFAIRTFLNNFEKETWEQMKKWSKSKDFHKRRLASEGTRLRLPWGEAIKFNYKKSLAILDNLFYDKERYVTRSLSNHLNDISKINAELVIKKLLEWKKTKKQKSLEMDYIINHSLRTLIKKGNLQVLKFLGCSPDIKVQLTNFKVKKKEINLGETLFFSFNLSLKSNVLKGNLMVDYKIIYFTPVTNKKANGNLSQKFFKLKKIKIEKSQKLEFNKKHLFRKMSTKKLYQGEHELQIQVNGKILAKTTFYLKI